jgi:hypothetical protein
VVRIETPRREIAEDYLEWVRRLEAEQRAYVGPIPIPTALGFWLIRHSRAWQQRYVALVHPMRLHPETLYGYDGEPPYFLRGDLASTREEVATKLAGDAGMPLEEFGEGLNPIEEIDQIYMTPRAHKPCTVDDCEDDDCNGHDEDGWYDIVEEGTPGAVRYWRWSW